VVTFLALFGLGAGAWWAAYLIYYPAGTGLPKAPTLNGPSASADNDSFVPAPSAAAAVVPALAKTAFEKGPYRKGELILRAKTDAELAVLVQRALKAGAIVLDSSPGLRAVRMRFADSSSMANFLNQTPDAANYELNYTVKLPTPLPPVDPNAPGSLQPFGSNALSYMGVPSNNGSWGKGITVAMLDTGLSPGATNLMPGASVNELDLVGGDPPPAGHGDMVAALLLGTNAETGIIPGANLLSIRVLGPDDTGDVFTVASGIEQAVEQGAKIINLSLGTDQSSDLLAEAVSYAQSNGVILVAAVGNDGVGQISYPAAYPGVVAVGAVDASGQRATFSNYGPEMTISAPGVGLTTQSAAGLESFSGTSAAAPLVSGAIASLMSTDPSMTGQQALGLLQQYADYEGPVSDDNQNEFYGNGTVDLTRVLDRTDQSRTDVALSDLYLDVGNASGTGVNATVPLQVIVQNRGNTQISSAQLNVDVGGQLTPATITGLAPNQVKEITINVPMSQLTSATGAVISASVTNSGPDVNLLNNNLGRVLKIQTAASANAPAPTGLAGMGQ
jgi:hypothetical protein